VGPSTVVRQHGVGRVDRPAESCHDIVGGMQRVTQQLVLEAAGIAEEPGEFQDERSDGATYSASCTGTGAAWLSEAAINNATRPAAASWHRSTSTSGWRAPGPTFPQLRWIFDGRTTCLPRRARR
jgi:hypothetical protein